MPAASALATLDVAAILEAPGSGPASGPVRIRIADGRIAAIEPLAGDGDGSLAIAAPANAHDHGRGLRTLAFGAVDDALEAWIPTLYREPMLDPYRRAVVAFARMAEGGVAATNHSHGPQDEDNLFIEAEGVSRAARDVGIHVAFAAPFADRNPLVYGDQQTFLAAAEPALRPGLEASLRPPKNVRDFLRLVDEEMTALEHPWFSLQYCPIGVQWVSDASMAAIAEASAANGRRIHIHLLETRYQREWADHAYPGGLIKRLDEIGFLSPRLSVAHGVFLREEESALLGERGVIVSVNTSSNFRLRSGIAPVAGFVRAGLRFGMGLDSQPLDDDDDMLREMRLVWLNHRGFGLEDAVSTARVFEAAAIDGRRAVIGEDGGGRIAVGAPADILVLDYAGMAPDLLSSAADPTNVLLTRATRKHIRKLIVAGRVVVEDGRCVTVDKPALEAELIAEAKTAWAAAPPSDGETVAMKRAIHRYYGCSCHAGGVLR
ncbi:MAG: amidohydrolase family protein [Hyphomonadaceae bacterium]